MDKTLIQNIAISIILVVIQVLICNHIMLFGVAIPFIFIYILLRLPVSMKTSGLLTWAFLLGLIVDIFSDTPGLNSLGCTILAILKSPILFSYIPRDDRTKDITPSISTLGLTDYLKYSLSMSLIYCVLIISIEYSDFRNVKDIAIMSLSSGLFTFLLLLGIDNLVTTRRTRRV